MRLRGPSGAGKEWALDPKESEWQEWKGSINFSCPDLPFRLDADLFSLGAIPHMIGLSHSI